MRTYGDTPYTETITKEHLPPKSKRENIIFQLTKDHCGKSFDASPYRNDRCGNPSDSFSIEMIAVRNYATASYRQ